MKRIELPKLKDASALCELLLSLLVLTSCASKEDTACELVTQLLAQSGENAVCKSVELGRELPPGQYRLAKAHLSDGSEFRISVSVKKDSIFVAPPLNFTVRKSTLQLHQNLTIEKAFENAFGNVKWGDAISPSGVRYVEMVGTVDDWFIKKLYSIDPFGEVAYSVWAQSLQLGLYAMAGFQSEMNAAATEMLDVLCIGNSADTLAREMYWSHKLIGPDSVYNKKRMAKLPAPGSKIRIQFQFSADGEEFELSYWGLDTLAGNCKLNKLLKSTGKNLNLVDFLDWVYSDHVYEPTGYKVPPLCNEKNEGKEFDGLKCTNGKYDLVCNDSLDGTFMEIKDSTDKKIWGDARVCDKGNWRRASEQELLTKNACTEKNEGKVVSTSVDYHEFNVRCQSGQWYMVCDEKIEGFRRDNGSVCENGEWVKKAKE